MVLLGFASGLSPFGMALLVPTLNLFGQVFDATPGSVQFLVSGYVLGLTLAQPLHGSLSDRFGRRPVMLAGLAVFVVASLVCMLADSLAFLIAGRLFQALGVSVGTVVSRAVIRDVCDAEGTARALTVIGAALGIAPIVAPALGGYLSAGLGWESIFLVASLAGALVMVAIWLRMPETRDTHRHNAHGSASQLSNFQALLGSPTFWGYTLIYGFTSACFFCFLTVGAAIFDRELGIDQQTFGLIWGAMGATYVAGAALGNPLTRLLGARATLKLGTAILVVAGLAMPASMAGFGGILLTLMVPLGVLMTASGFIGPVALAGAVSHRPDIAGTGSGLSSSLGLFLTAIFAVVAGSLYDGSAIPIALLIALTTVATAAALVLALRPTQLH